MTKKLLILISLFTITSSAYKKEDFHEFRSYLISTYNMHQGQAANIVSKAADLNLSIINEFIKKTYQLYISTSTGTAVQAGDYDAVTKAPLFHEVLFENDQIRILWTVTKPGEQEPLHMHYYQSIMMIVHGAHFVIDYADGLTETGHWPVGIYELPADLQPAAYKNRGDSEFRALRFEVKK